DGVVARVGDRVAVGVLGRARADDQVVAGVEDDGRGDVGDVDGLGVGGAGVSVGVGRRGADDAGRRGRAVGEGALEGAARVRVLIRERHLSAVGAAAGLDRADGVVARVGDGVAVGVLGRALADVQVVAGVEDDGRGAVGDVDGLGGGGPGVTVGAGTTVSRAAGRRGRAVGEGALEGAARVRVLIRERHL